jgi:hypothetical protein
MACLLGVQQSFGKAEVALREVAGWELDDNTIRRLCHAIAQQAAGTREQRATADAFARAPGDLELQIDAGKDKTAASAASRRRLRSGTSATCRRRRFGRWWPPWKRRKTSASAAPGRRSGWG